MPSWKASWCSTPCQEHHDYIRPLKLLHMDLFGPIAYLSIGGNKYGPIIVDDFSRFTWVFFLQEKSEAQRIHKKFIRRAQNEY
jgi:hypothetical protein